jgi:hypothetical protein
MACPLCEHLRIKAIEAALASGRAPKLVCAQFRLELQRLQVHIAHRTREGQALPQGAARKASAKKALPSEGRHTGRFDAALQVARARKASASKGLAVTPDASEPSDPDASCGCYWCTMSVYQRLIRAWAQAERADKERFCVEMREFDVPF